LAESATSSPRVEGDGGGGHRVADDHPPDGHQVAGLGVEHVQRDDEPECQPAALQPNAAVRQPLGLAKLVRDEHERQRQPLPQVEQRPLDRCLGTLIQRRGRLVQQ
jgi:hypothetical protein